MLFTELYINHVFGFLISPLALEITKVISVSFGWVGSLTLFVLWRDKNKQHQDIILQ